MQYDGPPFDPEEIKRTAQSLIDKYCDKHKTVRHAMERQNKQHLATPGKYFWAAVAQAIRRWRFRGSTH
jgi:hypothetical protein